MSPGKWNQTAWLSRAPQKGRWIRISYRWNNALCFLESLCEEKNGTMTRPFCPYTFAKAWSRDFYNLTSYLFTNDVSFSLLFPWAWSLMRSDYWMQRRKGEHCPSSLAYPKVLPLSPACPSPVPVYHSPSCVFSSVCPDWHREGAGPDIWGISSIVEKKPFPAVLSFLW